MLNWLDHSNAVLTSLLMAIWLIRLLKRAASSEPKESFGYDAKKWGYHIQDAMAYRDDFCGIRWSSARCSLVESKAPCVVTAPVMMLTTSAAALWLSANYRDCLTGRLSSARLIEMTDFPQIIQMGTGFVLAFWPGNAHNLWKNLKLRRVVR